MNKQHVSVYYRVFKTIGCPHGCGDGFRGPIGDHLRVQGVGCLTRLQRINPPQFRHYLRHYLIQQPLQDIVDFLHALLGFCVDPASAAAMSPQGEGERDQGAEGGIRGEGGIRKGGKEVGREEGNSCMLY